MIDLWTSSVRVGNQRASGDGTDDGAVEMAPASMLHVERIAGPQPGWSGKGSGS